MFCALFLRRGAREAPLVHLAHLAVLLTHGSNQQRANMMPEQPSGRRWADVGRIQPVRFGDAALLPVPLGSSSRARLDGQPSAFEAFVQCPPYTIEGCGILERMHCLRLDVGKAELLRGAITFLLVASLASQRQVGHPVTASAHFWYDVLDLQGRARLLAISALVAPLEQQVLFELVAGQRAVLVCCPRDLGILQGLGVEACRLIRKRADRAPTPQARYPGLDIAHAADERGR